jgi:hypothetical protein
MNRKMQLLGVWSGAAFFLFLLIGWVGFARWFPPLRPSADASQIADIFRADAVRIRIGMIFLMFGSGFYLPWTVLLSILIKQIEKPSIFLSWTQLIAGVMSALTIFIPSYLWVVAAFRPERNPEITQIIADIAWLMFVTGVVPFLLQLLTLAAAIFMDKRQSPAFPRWMAYFLVWVSISFLPTPLAFFMKTGPFAWNGLLSWWVPLTLFFIWLSVVIPLARQAVLRGAGEQS